MHRDRLKALVFRAGLGRLYANGWWVGHVRRRSPWVEWNRENRAVFIHVPKNAGSSIYKMFGITPPPETHCTALGYRAADPALWQACYSFAIVRNPWDRFVSAFHYLKQRPASADDAAWAQEMLAPYADFPAFERAMIDSAALRAQVLMWRHFMPQWFFLADFAGRLMIEELVRFEALEEGLARVGERIGIAPRPARENVAERAPYQAHYTAQGRALVARLYARDCEMFGYSFADPPTIGANAGASAGAQRGG